jgi:hypothetical protein
LFHGELVFYLIVTELTHTQSEMAKLAADIIAGNISTVFSNQTISVSRERPPRFSLSLFLPSHISFKILWESQFQLLLYLYVQSRKPKLKAVGIRCADHATPSIG